MSMSFQGCASSMRTLAAHRLKKEYLKKRPLFLNKANYNRPDLIFLINPNENRHVVEEAVSLNIPVVAITDSNTNLLGISYPIPGNSNSIEFVHYCLQWIARVTLKSTLK